jgi:hypothetical protein
MRCDRPTEEPVIGVPADFLEIPREEIALDLDVIVQKKDPLGARKSNA